MVERIRRPLLIVGALVLTASVAGAQGYAVRSWGYYDPVPYGPVYGGTYSYSPYRPTVTLRDPWGRAYDAPLQPKVLYYDTPFLSQQGWYRPGSITVMPNSRPQAYTVPARPAGVVPPAYTVPARPVEPARPAAPPAPLPAFKYDGGPANPVPDVAGDQPPPKPAPPQVVPDPPKPIPPTVPAPRPATKATVPDRPGAIPSVPELPAIPKVPGGPEGPKMPPPDAGPAVPKLGPAPMDAPPAPRPGG